MTYDLVVLGAGPGGYDAAVLAAGRGLKTALIEKDEMGGTCLNRGCIPTKLMLGATSSLEEVANQSKVKIISGDIAVDFPAVQRRKERLLGATRKAMSQRLKNLGADLFPGRGSLAGPENIEIVSDNGQETVQFKNLIIATGSSPSSFPGMAPDGDAVIDSTGFLKLEDIPKSLIVIGAGYIGLEMAQIAHRLGADITILDYAERMAPMEDPEVSKALQSSFKRRKWDIRLGVKVSSVATKSGKALLTLDTGEELEADKALVAVGRRPNTGDLGLEKAGIETSGPGWINVDRNLAAAPGIYAVGDVNGRAMLAHAASHQAHYVVSRIAGENDNPYSASVPSVLYGSPEAMCVGAKAHELKDKGEPCLVSSFQLAASPMAQAHAATQGFVKVVWSGDRIVGVTAVGHDVSRLTTAAGMMVEQGWTVKDAEKFIFHHPSLDEMLKEAILSEQREA